MTEKIRYSSAPIMHWCTGDFEFRDGILELTPEQAEVFEKLLEGIPHRHKMTVRRIGAGEVVGEVVPQALQGGAHTGILKDHEAELQELRDKLAISEAKNRMEELNAEKKTATVPEATTDAKIEVQPKDSDPKSTVKKSLVPAKK